LTAAIEPDSENQELAMPTRFVFLALISLLAVTGCKASEQSATRDDSEAPSAQSESTERGEPSTDADEASEESRAPTQEQLGQLSKAAKKALEESDVYNRWASAAESGPGTAIAWYPFGTEGSGELAGPASALHSYMETVSVNELPVSVVPMNSYARKRGVDVGQIEADSLIQRLGKIGAALPVPFVGTGTLIRDASDGSVTYKLRIVVVSQGASQAAYDQTVATE
jgi:hypothetical protein